MIFYCEDCKMEILEFEVILHLAYYHVVHRTKSLTCKHVMYVTCSKCKQEFTRTSPKAFKIDPDEILLCPDCQEENEHKEKENEFDAYFRTLGAMKDD